MSPKPKRSTITFDELRAAAVEKAEMALVDVRAEKLDVERVIELLRGDRPNGSELAAAVSQLALSRARAEAAMREAHEAADRAVDAHTWTARDRKA